MWTVVDMASMVMGSLMQSQSPRTMKATAEHPIQIWAMILCGGLRRYDFLHLETIDHTTLSDRNHILKKEFHGLVCGYISLGCI